MTSHPLPPPAGPAAFPPPKPGAAPAPTPIVPEPAQLSPGARRRRPAMSAAVLFVAVSTAAGTYLLTRQDGVTGVTGSPPAPASTDQTPAVVATPNVSDQVLPTVELAPAPTLEDPGPLVDGGEMVVLDGAPPAEAPTVPTVLTAPTVTVSATALASAPTAPPTTSGPTCRSAQGWTLTIPAGWYTVAGSGACRQLAPYPITLYQDGSSDATLTVDVHAASFDQSATAVPEDRSIVDAADGAIGARRIRAVRSIQIGDGRFVDGTDVYEVWLEDGDRTIVFTTWSTDGGVEAAIPVMLALAASFTS